MWWSLGPRRWRWPIKGREKGPGGRVEVRRRRRVMVAQMRRNRAV